MSSQTVVVVAHPQKGQSPIDCKAMAEGGSGAKSYDAFGTACWDVYGMAVQINPVINSIMEGFMITNINFMTYSQPASSSADLGSSGMMPEGYTGS